MKNEILDDIFKDELRYLLESNEKVIWDGRPSITPSTKWSTFFGVLIVIFLAAKFIIDGVGISSFIYPIILAFMTVVNLIQSRKVRYIITDQRIIFQLWRKRKKGNSLSPTKRNQQNFD